MGLKAKIRAPRVVKGGKHRDFKKGKNDQADRPGRTKIRAFSCDRTLSRRVDDFCETNDLKFSPIVAKAIDEFLERNAW